METNEKGLKPEESLKIINDMISSAKSNLSDNSFYFLFWGWLIASANIGEFLIANLTNYQKPYIVWLIILPGILISFIYGYRKKKTKRVTSHLERIHLLVWVTYTISYFIMIIFINQINYKIPQLIFVLTGAATFLSGSILKFKPLVYGGILFWIGSILLFIVPDFYIHLLSAFLIILGFIVPGYMLKSYSKKNA